MARIALLVIGDEILAGHTLDTNTQFACTQFRKWGQPVTRVITCTDEISDMVTRIGELVRDNFDHIITSGGLGPTPDDRTMEAIALACGVTLELRPEHEAILREKIAERHKLKGGSEKPNQGQLKMAMVPIGSEALPNPRGAALGCIATLGRSKIYTLPGVPLEYERMLVEYVLPRIPRGTPKHVQELRIAGYESPFFEVLSQLEKDFPQLTIGSYPEQGFIRIRVSGDQKEANLALRRVREFSPFPILDEEE